MARMFDRKGRNTRGKAGKWREHKGDCALDEWGVALRDMAQRPRAEESSNSDAVKSALRKAQRSGQ